MKNIYMTFLWRPIRRLIRTLALTTLLANAANAVSQSPFSRSLMINELEVVNDLRSQNDGVWSFSHLLKTLAPTNTILEDYLTDWILEWRSTPSNENTPQPRPQTIKDLWTKDSLGRLIASRSPFRLLAVIHRPDLRTQLNPAGEGRFVFGLFNPKSQLLMPLTIIFEYRLPDSLSPQKWASKLRDLGLSPYNQDFKQKLEQMTRIWARPENLLSVRSNQLIGTHHWELRNFSRDSTGFLRSQFLPRSPALIFNDPNSNSPLKNWILDNQSAIRNGQYNLPNQFLSFASLIPDENFQWLKNQDLPEDVRKSFAMQTCNGCHAGESGTRFLHLNPRKLFEASRPSTYLISELATRIHAAESMFRGELKTLPLKSCRVH